MAKVRRAHHFHLPNSSARTVSFSPTSSYIFAAGGSDGNICLYHAGQLKLVKTCSVISSGLNRHIGTVKYNCDGSKVCW